MKNLIKSIAMSVLLIGSLAMAQDGTATKSQNFEQLKTQVKVEECINVSQTEKAQIEKAQTEMKQLETKLANCKSDKERENVRDQIKAQTQKQIQESIEKCGFDDATKARVVKAVEEMQKKLEQKQAQFKE